MKIERGLSQFKIDHRGEEMMREIKENILCFLVILCQENRFDIKLLKTVEKGSNEQINKIA